tara:strand:- start:112 stop:414 length:303 start_codon:yes stop_codon:yes gene_type:complete
MKALIASGIDESTVKVGTVLAWKSTNWQGIADTVSYLERNEKGVITAIAFASWLQIFNNKHKLLIAEPEAGIPVCHESAGDWVMAMIKTGRIELNILDRN